MQPTKDYMGGVTKKTNPLRNVQRVAFYAPLIAHFVPSNKTTAWGGATYAFERDFIHIFIPN